MNREFFNGSGLKRDRGSDIHANEMGDSHDAKKAKFDNPPSRVVHIRQLPNDANETDVVQMGMPFGKMVNCLLMRQKNQAFLEFADESCAINMVSYFKSNPAQMRHKHCYVQFSNHKELKTDLTSAKNSSAAAALRAAQGMMGASAGRGRGGGGDRGLSGDAPSILRVIVDNLVYPVSLETLHQLFSRFGKILKIIIFNKNNTFQALIQYLEPLCAETAKDSLDGQNIYNGCNTLKIDFSRMQDLQVKFNSDKTRDFTRPDLPSESEMEGLGRGGAGLMGSGPGDMAGALGLGLGGGLGGGLSALGGGLGGLGGLGGGLGGLGGGLGGLEAGLGGLMGAGGGMGGRGGLDGRGGLGAGLSQLMGNNFNFDNLRNNMDSMRDVRDMRDMQQGFGSPVVLASNFDAEKATPEAFFALFGCYGNVHRVKILFNKKDNVLIQMAEPHQAQEAIMNLERAKIWGKNLRVVPSKHMSIQMPHKESDAGLTKDFTNSPHHRFKHNGNNKNYIFPPTQVLHLYNVNVLEEDEIRNMFSQYGDIEGFKFFNNDRKMGLIEMATVEQATLALMGLHNYQVGESLHLRVSFSKSSLRGREPRGDRRDRGDRGNRGDRD